MLKPFDVLEACANVLHEGHAQDWKKTVILNGMHKLLQDFQQLSDTSDTPFGGPDERFELVDYEKHSILGQDFSNTDIEVEPGDIYETLHLLVDRTNPWNISRKIHDFKIETYPLGTVLKFWGVDGEFYIMPIATQIWHFQQLQEGILFKRINLARVTMYDDEKPNDGVLTAFIGPKDVTLGFAKAMTPHIREFSQADWRSYGGARLLPDGSQPWVGALGRLTVIVDGMEY